MIFFIRKVVNNEYFYTKSFQHWTFPYESFLTIIKDDFFCTKNYQRWTFLYETINFSLCSVINDPTFCTNVHQRWILLCKNSSYINNHNFDTKSYHGQTFLYKKLLKTNFSLTKVINDEQTKVKVINDNFFCTKTFLY